MDEDDLQKVSQGKLVIVVAAILVVIAAAILYALFIAGTSTFAVDVVIIFGGALLGVVGAIYFLGSVSEEDVGIEFAQGEDVLATTKDSQKRAFLSFPREEDGFVGEEAPLAVDLYLTNYGILAEPPESGIRLAYVLYERVSEIRLQEKFGKHYIRLKYYPDDAHLDEILLFLGDDTKQWYDRIVDMLQPR